jgi:hypothetical protein
MLVCLLKFVVTCAVMPFHAVLFCVQVCYLLCLEPELLIRLFSTVLIYIYINCVVTLSCTVWDVVGMNMQCE